MHAHDSRTGLEQVRLEPTCLMPAVLDRDSDVIKALQPRQDSPVPGGTCFDRELLEPAAHLVHRDERVPVLMSVDPGDSQDSPFPRPDTARAAVPDAGGHASVGHSNQ